MAMYFILVVVILSLVLLSTVLAMIEIDEMGDERREFCVMGGREVTEADTDTQKKLTQILHTRQSPIILKITKNVYSDDSDTENLSLSNAQLP